MYIADLHIHSKYSRATSKDCDVPHLDLWARYKGIGLLGTGDFTHPKWRGELELTLVPAEEGLYTLKEEYRLSADISGDIPAPRFVVSGEISTIYKKDGKTRKVHHLFLLPSLEAARTVSERLEAVGNLHSDGRPILGMDSRDLLALVLDCCPSAVYIPAHIWTPHFSLFGAFSDFSTLEECYGDLSAEIHALETGLSSDPPMNRRCSMLDKYTLVSNSDAHSPAKLGREGNLLSGPMSYPLLKRALETGDGLSGTLEFFPEEGKYHLDGHRACACRLTPEETEAFGGLCPVCGKKVTVGVLHRVEALADRPESVSLAGDKPFESLMPLPELLASILGVSSESARVKEAYFELLKRLGPEFHILRELSAADAAREISPAFGEALKRLRAGKVFKRAGYDGEFGVISLFAPGELNELNGQTSLLPSAAFSCAASPRRALAPTKQGPEKVAQKAQETPVASFNEKQAAAISSDAQKIAVIAGPGTGKTKTLVGRVAFLIQQKKVPPKQITAVTFTRQAAAEMRERLEKELGKKSRSLTVGTFHAISLRLCPGLPIIDGQQALDLMSELLKARADTSDPAEMLKLVSAVKSGVLEANVLPDGLLLSYQEKLGKAGARDLDDVLLDALACDTSLFPMFTHLLVDEFQDVNPLQRRLIEHWGTKNVFVIGDPDQSIYGFRGADATCFDTFAADAYTAALTTNYRSTPEILQSALSVIAHNEGRERALVPALKSGQAVRVLGAPDPFQEGVLIAREIRRMTGGLDMLEAAAVENARACVRAFSDIAVLCRTRRQLELIETCLRHDSIPCVVLGRGSFLTESTSRGLTGFFRSLLEPDDALALADALKMLWHCPLSLILRAQEAMQKNKAKDMNTLFDALRAYDGLLPWLAAARELSPKLASEKPRRLLETLCQMAGVPAKNAERLLNAAVFEDTMPAFLDAVLQGEEADIRRQSGACGVSGAVRLMTLHGAKGLEFPVVFVSGTAKGELPLERKQRPTDVSEERRLFFVGMTRAREELIITFGGEPSPFLAELPAEIKPCFFHPVSPRAEQLSLF